MSDIDDMAAEIVRLRKDREWRDILSTAPINTPVLVWHPGFGMGGWHCMRCDHFGDWHETAHDGRSLKKGYEPSHWMPLPPPPEKEKT